MRKSKFYHFVNGLRPSKSQPVSFSFMNMVGQILSGDDEDIYSSKINERVLLPSDEIDIIP